MNSKFIQGVIKKVQQALKFIRKNKLLIYIVSGVVSCLFFILNTLFFQVGVVDSLGSSPHYYCEVEPSDEVKKSALYKQYCSESFSGMISYPVADYAKWYISSPFGPRVHPISGKVDSFHYGIDIAAPQGTPILAQMDGEVLVAEYGEEGYGNHVYLQHDNDILTVYAHCVDLNVKKGQKVRAGEVIAYVGTTGASTGPHLHFEYREHDTAIDPMPNLIEKVTMKQ